MDDAVLREMRVDASLGLLPPRIRHSLLNDGEFLAKWQINTTTNVSLNRGGPSLTREDLYDAIRRAIASEGSPAAIKDKAGKDWSVLATRSDGRLRFSMTDESHVINISDHTGLSADRAQRLEWFERAAAASNLPAATVVEWTERLSGEALTDDEFAALHLALATSPFYIARELRQILASGSANLESLIPKDLEYYERLVGQWQGAATAADFVKGPLAAHLHALLDWSPPEGLRQAFALGLGGQALTSLDASRLADGDLAKLIDWLEVRGDPLSKVAAIEFVLHRIDELPEYEPNIIRLAQSIIGDDPDAPGSPIALMSAMTVLVGAEMARRRVAAATPPYWRRMAAFAHGSILTRAVIEAQLDIADFTRWVRSQGTGHVFLLQGLIDLRTEPRWLPDFVGDKQMKAESLGRFANAADLTAQMIRSEEVRSALLADDGMLRTAIRLPFCMLPGPLEGGLSSVPPMPDGVLDDVASALETESLTSRPFAGLVNASLFYGGSPDLSALAASALRRVKYSIENDGDEATLFGLIGGLAAVSSVTRSADLADELRILTRVLRRRKRLVVAPEDELRIALIATASRAEVEPWAAFAGDWISEIAFETTDRDDAVRMLLKIRRLVHLEPVLAAPCATADAALSGFSDWR